MLVADCQMSMNLDLESPELASNIPDDDDDEQNATKNNLTKWIQQAEIILLPSNSHSFPFYI